MTTKDEAIRKKNEALSVHDTLKLALEALEHMYIYTSPPYEATPLASQRSVKPLVYATTWRGLTDSEIEKLAVESGKATFLNDDEQTDVLWFDGDGIGFARAIEAKLREKNA